MSAGFLFSPAFLSYGQTPNCSPPPAPDPTKTFLQNFLTACYAYTFPATTSTGQNPNSADLIETYAAIFYRVNPGYEVLFIGNFPQSRFLDIAAEDSHKFTQKSFYDAQLTPLTSTAVNPFLPGVTYRPNQLYAVALQFGGTQPTNVQPGCGYGGLNFYANVVDGTKRHAGVSWNGSPLVPPGFPAHDDDGPNTGGMVNVRQYLNETTAGAVSLTTPVAIVRDLSTGCAVPVAQAVAQSSTNLLPSQVIGRNTDVEQSWLDLGQIAAHTAFSKMKPTYCYTLGANIAPWFRSDEYTPNPDPEAGYMTANLARAALNWVIPNKGFMRLRFQLPTMPDTPCAGCSLSGSEQLRYFDLWFENSQGYTLATIGSESLVTDPNGYVTLIVGFGAAPPSWVKARNYYTYLDLSKVPGFANLSGIGLRTILPSPAFACAVPAVNYKTSEDNSLGGFMGPYVPVVDVLAGANIPPVATPIQVPDSCGLVPPELPVVCGP